MNHACRVRVWVIAGTAVAVLLLVVGMPTSSDDQQSRVEPASPEVSHMATSSEGLRGPPDRLPPPGRTSGARVQALTGSHTWWDGDKEVTVWLDPTLLAEFPTEIGSSIVVERGLAERARHTARGVRLWELSQTTDPVDASRTLADATRAYPVLRDAPHTGAPIRALTGRIVVQLEPGWTDAQVEGWANDRDLRLVRRLTVGPGWFVFEVDGGGLESLHAANRLREEPHVISAAPDWWRKRQLR